MSKSIVLSLLLWTGVSLTRAAEAAPRYFAVSPGALAEVKSRLAAGDPLLQPALSNLVREAEEALHITPPSVVFKSKTPPSGDKHDYLTVGPYWWPDPARSNGLPYVRHDGKVNPESRTEAYDRVRMASMASTIETLALAYYFTGDDRYAAHAARCLKVWFLDPATRMTPHLNFAQGIPGVRAGRGVGIIEGRNLSEAADAAGLLIDSPAWAQSDVDALKVWLEAYLDWLLTSEIGREEANARNNHGSFYDVQVTRLALILGRTGLAEQTVKAARQKRIAVQIEADGRQPLELARTAALGYSRFNLEALFALATLGEYVGVDLWHDPLPDGRGLDVALEFLLPYIADPSKPWPYEQIKPVHRTDFAPLLRQAAIAYHNPRYETILRDIPGTAGMRFQLLYPLPGLLIDVAAQDRRRILKAADAALDVSPITITKFRAPLSEGGPHDFYSNGDYWWPDPAKPDGLPYVRRDGETNPDNFNQHRLAIRQLRDAVAALAAAYRITGEDQYAGKAAALLRVFFLDPSTRMNPNLQYAQAIPGRSPGRGIGIIDTLHLIEIPIAVEAMEPSTAFPPETLAGLKQWFGDYLGWMLTSGNGREEAAAKNNHAVAFWLQAAVFAGVTGDEACRAECCRQFREVFVPTQMAADGSFPLELSRTKPYGYSIFQLDNLATLCQVLSTPTNNLWTFELPDGRGMRKAMAYLYPYLADKTRWPLSPDVQAWDGWPTRQPCLLFAGLAFREPKYLDLWRSLPPDPTDDEVQRNIAITQPLLWLNPSLPGQEASATGPEEKALNATAVLNVLERVGDWALANPSLANPSNRRSTDWTKAALYAGLLALSDLSSNPAYVEALLQMGESNAWALGPRKFHADDHCVGQTYADLYLRRHADPMIEPMRAQFDDILANPSAVESLEFTQPGRRAQELWSWCDSLFMAPPAWVRLWVATGDARYLDFAVTNWWRTSDYLYDPGEHLYYRDSTFFEKREANGRKVFWSRGNGWVMGGLVRVMQLLPEDHPERTRWEAQFCEMANTLLICQQPDGLWRASLLDPESYPLKETSGSSFFTYAFAWGVNTGLLDRQRFEPATRNAWLALVKCVTAEGKLTHVQPIGSDPKHFDENSTEAYGIGAFLLAGTEVYRMASPTAPARKASFNRNSVTTQHRE